MIHDENKFRECLKTILLSDYGLSIESEGTVYVRSLDDDTIAAGILADDGGIEHEQEFGSDIESALDYFLKARIPGRTFPSSSKRERCPRPGRKRGVGMYSGAQ